jgi:hypothetical protein
MRAEEGSDRAWLVLRGPEGTAQQRVVFSVDHLGKETAAYRQRLIIPIPGSACGGTSLSMLSPTISLTSAITRTRHDRSFHVAEDYQRR